MKISEKLPQFENRLALFIVAGTRTAEFYLAGDGAIDKINELRVEAPKYSDREGFFTRSGKGERLGSGSVYEAKKDKMRSDFHRELSEAVKKSAKKIKITHLYIFAPNHNLSSMRAVLPVSLRKTPSREFAGNYTKLKPFELIGLISEKRENRKLRAKRKIVPSAARKILRKARKARRVKK